MILRFVGVLLVLVIAGIGFTVPNQLMAAVNCPPGTRPATMADLVVKEGTIAVGTCYNPTDRGISKTGLEAKEYLKKLPCPSGNCDFGQSFNDSFAICAANFFKAYQTKYGGVQINSAYRSPDRERQICRNNPACGAQMNNPNPTSNHSKGVAIDVQPAGGESQYPLLWGFAKANPQFGVCFPFEDGSGGGFRDRPHMILAGLPGSQEAASCVKRGYGNKPCDGANFDPSTFKDATFGSSATTPTSNFADAIRQALGLQTAQQLIQPAVAQPYAQTQPVLNTFAMPTQPTPTTGVTPTTGTGATAVTPASSDTGATAATGGVSDKLFTETGKTTATGSPLADKLNELAFGVSAGNATSGIPFIPLAINPDDRSDRAATSTGIAQIVATKTPSITTDTTFLGGNPNPYPTTETTISQGNFLQILATIKVALLNLLARLRPFATQSVPEY